jgi:diamine N-acetyltransferase
MPRHSLILDSRRGVRYDYYRGCGIAPLGAISRRGMQFAQDGSKNDGSRHRSNGRQGVDGSSSGVVVRPAGPDDTSLIFALIRELAAYEKLGDAVDATQAMIADALFGEKPRLFCDIPEWNGEAAGLAVWFLNFSTFRGRHGIYLEDLFVRPAYRGKGLGKALMMRLATRCVEEGYARFEWSVLDWNAPSIAFYQSIGAQVLPDWKICRMSGEALSSFGKGARV